MPTTRPIARPIIDLIALSMGQPLLRTGTNPSGFNDLANEMAAIDHAGTTISYGSASCTGGLYRPILGDYGNTFIHHLPISQVFRIELFSQYNRYQLAVHCKSISPTHYLTCRIERDANGSTYSQFLMNNQSTTQLGPGSRTHLFHGPLSSNHQVSGQIDEIRLIFESDKGALGGTSASATTTYWDGFLTFQLKLFRQ